MKATEHEMDCWGEEDGFISSLRFLYQKCFNFYNLEIVH